MTRYGMERRRFLKTSGIVLTAAGVAGCSSGSSTSGGTETTTTTASDGTTVDMVTDGGDYYFDPIGLFVEAGETVTFRNDSGRHSTVAYEEGNGQASTTRIPDGAEAWKSSVLGESGQTFEHTFETTGTYDYFCGPHKSIGMVGRIVVGETGGPAEGSMPPDGEVPDGATIVEEGSVSYESFSG